MAHFIGLDENATAQDMADSFLPQVWQLHGLLTAIPLHMDVRFSSELWESLCKMLGVKQFMSTPYHPQTD